jgi:DNA-binding response OmpR family regulator
MHQILVIDDQEFILDTVRDALTMNGYAVEVAADGQEGIQKFDDGNFDLVITDMKMPGLDGSNVVEHIRNSDRHFTPIIGFSGTPWLLQKSDFDIVFVKPFPLQDLVNAIQNLSAIYSKAVGHK